MGIREIAGVARDLAEASQRVQANGPIHDLIESVATALLERVTALAPPPPAS